jgi:uncharacterized iron-regulated membrane protein
VHRATRIPCRCSSPLRGAWRGLHPAAAVAMAAVTVIVGWFAPLLGLSLLAFLFVDAVVAAVNRRRSPQISAPATTPVQ